MSPRARAAERSTGAAAERARIRAAQAPALRDLRVLLMPECSGEGFDALPGCSNGRHAEDCGKGLMLDVLRALRAATRSSR